MIDLAQWQAIQQAPVTLVVHGVAVTLTRADLVPDQERACREALGQALRGGQAFLLQGGNAPDAGCPIAYT